MPRVNTKVFKNFQKVRIFNFKHATIADASPFRIPRRTQYIAVLHKNGNTGYGVSFQNLIRAAKGKGASGCTARAKVLMRGSGADCSVVAVKRGNSRGAKGAGDLRGDR
jgi:hypothetical protein